MTDRMHDELLDREIRGFLAGHAEDVSDAPTAAEVAMRISARVVTPALGLRLTPRLGWVLLAGLLMTALLGAALSGAFDREDLTNADPTNGWIAYSTRSHSALGGVTGDIYIVRPGQERRLLTGDEGQSATCPSFSPDGLKLSYFRGRNLVVLEGDVAREARTVAETSLDGQRTHGCPAWSPGSDTIAVLTDGDIWLVGLDGSISKLHFGVDRYLEFDRSNLAWSPDGSRLAVSMQGGIWIVPRVASPFRLATAQSGSLTWSPDGSQLVFTEEGPAWAEGGSVTVARPDTPDHATSIGVGSTPIWSPHGDAIAFGGADGVVVARADGSNPKVVGVPGAYGFGGWPPDGDWLLQMVDISGRDWDLVSSSADGASHSVIAAQIPAGARNWPGFGDVSWQPVYP